MYLNTERIYKLIAIASFIVLMILQYQLISGTYKIKSNDLFKKEKSKLKVAYERAIINDKLFPGGQAIIDSVLLPKMSTLDSLYQKNPELFKKSGTEIYDEIVRKLRDGSTMDSLFGELLKKENLDPNFKYTLVLGGISVTFDGHNFIDLLDSGPLLSQDTMTIIQGDPQLIQHHQMISSLFISSHLKYSNRVEFSLYADKDGKTLAVLKNILPLLLLSGCCLLAVVGIYFLTFNNWVRQKKMNEMTTDFLNNITHEFNTPLATIQVASKNVRRDIPADGTGMTTINLDIIDRQTSRLDKLINQAINVSKFSPHHVEKDIYNLHELLDESVTDLCINYGKEVEIDYSPKDEEKQFHILTNRFMFTTLLNNLVENGVKYNNQKDKHIYIWVAAKEQLIELHVKDNGNGIDKETLTHMFKKFFRGKQEFAKNGVGLGLYYVQQTVAQHDWDIKVDTVVGEGSEFILLIPMVEVR
ncbi:sensor histidine kinase [Sphingobacterium spiritivorum]|uniref:sensor histidine kinase n=1 Tax=Sphingobacterium spiritivorum TaxID=258 RepID=UPI003DA2F4A4